MPSYINLNKTYKKGEIVEDVGYMIPTLQKEAGGGPRRRD